MTLKDRFRGCLIGLAAGDALGTTLEFTPFDCVDPIDDMIGGGPFSLEAGQWTDDTSMALCLAESLVETGVFDVKDQMERYLDWYDHGHLSSTGECFDIGNTTSSALETFRHTDNPWAGPTDPDTAGNGSLMRLAPIPMFYAFGFRGCPVNMSEASSRTTHGAVESQDACRFYGGLIAAALRGVDKDVLLSSIEFGPDSRPWDYPWFNHRMSPYVRKTWLCPEIKRIANGSYRELDPPVIQGTGRASTSLEAALWAFHRTSSFEEGALAVVNLGEDADTTGAIYGQLAGAYYGLSGIPEHWVEKITMVDYIRELADKLRIYARPDRVI